MIDGTTIIQNYRRFVDKKMPMVRIPARNKLLDQESEPPAIERRQPNAQAMPPQPSLPYFSTLSISTVTTLAACARVACACGRA